MPTVRGNRSRPQPDWLIEHPCWGILVGVFGDFSTGDDICLLFGLHLRVSPCFRAQPNSLSRFIRTASCDRALPSEPTFRDIFSLFGRFSLNHGTGLSPGNVILLAISRLCKTATSRFQSVCLGKRVGTNRLICYNPPGDTVWSPNVQLPPFTKEYYYRALAEMLNPPEGAQMEDHWLSVSEIAIYLGITPDSVYRWIDSKGSA